MIGFSSQKLEYDRYRGMQLGMPSWELSVAKIQPTGF